VKIKGEWCYFKEHFSDEECQKILDDGLKLPAENAKLGFDGESQVNNYRKSKIRFIQKHHSEFEWLFDRMWKLAIQANDDWFNFHITKITYMQLAEYDATYEGEYKKHNDVFWINNDPFYHRKLTSVVQLSKPESYTGGDLILYTSQENPESEQIKTQGTTIFFPSFLDHQANSVTKGTRYSLACWFDGPKWR
jgi:PKHD-type hydroxylase